MPEHVSMLQPHMGQINGRPILMVDGKPFIMLAGEVHNSSSSYLTYMEQVWEKAEALGMNCLLLPVTWELTEPEEGRFDFSLVRGLIEQARRYGKKISFLWFGAWKNAQCYYAPEWVKTDLARFHRAQVVKGKNFIYNADFYDMPYSSLSYLCEETYKADTRAFGRLMAYIREIDNGEHTVVSVQVENETGGDYRSVRTPRRPPRSWEHKYPVQRCRRWARSTAKPPSFWRLARRWGRCREPPPVCSANS